MSSYLWYILGYNEEEVKDEVKVEEQQRRSEECKEVKKGKESSKEFQEVKEHLELIKEHLLKYSDILEELRPILAKRREALEIYFENNYEQAEYEDEIHHLYTTEESESEDETSEED